MSQKGYASVFGDFRPGFVDTVNSVRIDQSECDTFTCGHCSRVVHVPVKARPADIGGMCKQCMALTCPRCTALAQGRCTPLEKRLEAMEQRNRIYGQVTGR